MFWGLLAQPAGRSDWPAENYPVRTHIATPENLMPFCYISPDWTSPCFFLDWYPVGPATARPTSIAAGNGNQSNFLPIAECNASCDWMALVHLHFHALGGNFRQSIVGSEGDRT